MLNICGRKLIDLSCLLVKQKPNWPKVFGQHKRQVSTKKRPKIPKAEHKYPGQKDEHSVTPFGWALLAIPVTTFGLGCWQVKRKSWKENLIKQLEETTKMPPVELPDDLNDLKNMQYRAVKVRGEFLHDKEMLLGPRGMLNKGDSMTTGGLISRQETSIGFLVITPFQLKGREEKILINRGWVPKRLTDQSTRQEGQIQGPVEVTGVVRLHENRPQFMPKQRGDIFLFRDVEKMSNLTGTEPVYLDASLKSTVPGGPIGGQTRVTLRNEHLSYIVTWFSLSGFTSWLWFRQVMRGKSF